MNKLRYTLYLLVLIGAGACDWFKSVAPPDPELPVAVLSPREVN